MKSIFFALLLAFSMQANAADNDTLVVNKPNKVTVVAGDSVQKILIEGREGDENYVYRNTIQSTNGKFTRHEADDKDSWDIIPSVKVGSKKNKEDELDELSMRLAFGINAPVNVDERVDFSAGSWEVWWTPFSYQHFFNKKKNNSIEFGLGLDWRNYRMKKDLMFVKNADGMVDVTPYPDGVKRNFSRIKVFSLTANVLYHHMFSKKFGLGLGPIVNFNLGSSVKTKYKEDGKKYTVSEKKVGHRPVTVDFMGLIEYDDNISIYVKYSPNHVLKDGGIKFQSVTVGFFL